MQEVAKKDQMPPEKLGRWNWGAFLLNWIWGIGNRVWISFLVFIPIFGIIWIFVLAIKGNKWAWKKGKWDSIEHFKRVQHKWAVASGIFLAALVLLGVIIFVSVVHSMNSSWASKNSFKYIQNNQQVQQVLGSPIERSWFTEGNVSVNADGSGKAFLQYSINGPKGEATAYVAAQKHSGKWGVFHLVVVPKGNNAQKLVLIRNGYAPRVTHQPDSVDLYSQYDDEQSDY